MDGLHIGVGRLQPLDTDEYVEITLYEKDGCVAKADFTFGGDEATGRCAEAVCRAIAEHGITELFQMNNNVVYYNTEPALAVHELYKACIAVRAAKRAAADWCKKNGVPVPAQPDGCSCISE